MSRKMGVTLRPRERRLALIAAVMIGAWVIVSWLVQPLWDRVHDLQLHVETQREKFDALSHLLAQAPSIERTSQSLAAFLQAEDGEQVQEAFLAELEDLSRRSNLRMNSKQRPMKRTERVNRFEVELDLEGSQKDLLAFLDALLTMPKLLTIERLRIVSVPTKENTLRANLVINRVSFFS